MPETPWQVMITGLMITGLLVWFSLIHCRQQRVLILYVPCEIYSSPVRKAVSRKAGKSEPKQLLGIPGIFISVRATGFKSNLERPSELGNANHSHSTHTRQF